MEKFKNNRKNPVKNAFSLIELVIVISLIGTIIYLGMPYLRTFLQYSSLKKDAWDIMADLRSCRQMAIVEHVNYSFIFDLNNDSYVIEKRDAATNGLLANIATKKLANNIIQASGVTFRPKGEASSAAAIVIQGKDPGDKITITVYATTGLAKMSQ